MPKGLTLHDLQAILVDMDGVLYRGNTPLPGAQAFLAWLSERRFPFLLLTNNSTLDPWSYEHKLSAMGFGVAASQILTSSVATADYLAGHFAPGTRVYVVGEAGLQASVADRGFAITDRDPAAVVVGLDRELSYAKLRAATLAIRAGAPFIATNPDRTLPTEAGDVPGAGAIVAALVAATDQQPLIIGKPEPTMLEMALARLGQAPERTAMLGDRLETDILAGERLGMPTILVLSGVTRQAPPKGSRPQPTWVFGSVEELHAAWRQPLPPAPMAPCA